MITETNSIIQQAFTEIEDPRQQHKVEHPLENILFITLCGILCGAEKFTEIVSFAHSQKPWLQQYLNLENGIPSDDTLNRTLGLIATASFSQCFLAWMKLLGIDPEIQVAIDGKLLRGSGSKPLKGKDALDMVTAFAVTQGLTLAQQVVSEKSNEITAIPHLLNMLNLKGCVVTIDAMGCQKTIVSQIVEAGADYVIALKKNQGHLYEDANEMFDYLLKHDSNKLDHTKTTEKGHGRLEIRECWTFDPRLYADYFRTLAHWVGIQRIAVVRSRRLVQGVETIKTRFFISSVEEGAVAHLRYVRSHWAIENKAHWILDVALREDAHQLKHRTTAANLSILRQLVRNLLTRDTKLKGSTRTKILRCSWNINDRELILRQLFPSL